MFNITVEVISVGFIYFSTLFLYSFHRYIGVVNTPTNELISDRMIWSKKNLRAILFITICSGMFAMVSFLLMPFKPFFTLIPCSIIALGYSIPIWLKNGKLVRLRDINGIKIFLIGLVVSIITIMIPVKESFNFSIFLTLFARISFVLAITIPFDIRDVELDTKHNLKTIPSKMGVQKAKNLSIALLGIFVVISWLSEVFTKAVSINIAIALSISGLIAIPVILLSNKHKSDYFFAFVVEGLMIVQFLLVLFVSKI